MPRTQLLWIPALSIVAATVGCSAEMPVAQAPSTSPPPNTTTISSPDAATATATTSDGMTPPPSSADPGAVTPPMPGTEGAPVTGETVGTLETTESSIPTSETPGSVPPPDYSVVPTEGAAPTEGAVVPPGLTEGSITPEGTITPDGSMPNYGQPGVATAPPEKPFEEMTLAERAESCFKKGKETEGFRWLYAHAIASEMDEAGETLDKLRWLPGPKRPSLAARFGVAVKFDSPVPLLALATAMPAVGDPVPGLIRRKEGDPAPASETSATGRSKEIPKTAPETLRFFSGDVGVKFLERFETSRAEKAWGDVLGEMEGSGSLVAAATGANNPYGVEGSTITSPESSTVGSESASDRDRKKSTPSLDLGGGSQISPGIVWLGFDSSGAAAARKAAPLGVDCVLLVDVKIQLGRNAPPRNKTKITAMDVATAKPVYSSPILDQFDIYELRETRPNAPDPVEQAMKDLFEKMEPVYAMQDMPEISAESALNRARQLIADPPADPLPALAEMRYYLHKGLMDEAQYAIACKNLATEPGVGDTLGSQDEEERIAAVEKLVEAMNGDDEEREEASGDARKSDEKNADAEAPTDAAPVEP